MDRSPQGIVSRSSPREEYLACATGGAPIHRDPERCYTDADRRSSQIGVFLRRHGSHQAWASATGPLPPAPTEFMSGKCLASSAVGPPGEPLPAQHSKPRFPPDIFRSSSIPTGAHDKRIIPAPRECVPDRWALRGIGKEIGHGKAPMADHRFFGRS
jgi:hypothetical protein